MKKVFILFLALAVVIPQCFYTAAFAMHTTSKNTMWYSPENHKGFYETAMYINSYSEVIAEDFSNTYHLEITNQDGTVEKIYPDGKTFYRIVTVNPDRVKDPSWIKTFEYHIDPMYTRSYTLPDKEDPKIVDETIGDFVIGNGTSVVFNQYGNPVDTPFNKILKKYIGKGGNVVIPDGVQVIAGGVFKNRTDITSVTIPDSVLYIGGDAFRNSGISSVVIPSTVKCVYSFAFLDCKKLKYAIVEGNPEFWTGVFESYTAKPAIYSDGSNVKFYRGYDGMNVKPLSQAPVAKGTLTVDTTNYFLTPNNTYEIGTVLTGYGITLAASSNNSNVAKVTSLGNGKWKVSGVKAGCTSIVFGIYKSNKQIARIPVLVTVQSGISPHGDSTKRTVNF